MINETYGKPRARCHITLIRRHTRCNHHLSHLTLWLAFYIYDSLSVAKLLRKTVFYMSNGLRRPPGSLCNLLYSSSLKL